MKIQFASVFVDNQEKALEFYTEILGFVKVTDIPVGEFRFLTITSPEGPEGVELLLEPNAHPAVEAYQKAIFDDGIPAASFLSDDVVSEYERLKSLGVEFHAPPADMGSTRVAIFNDTCGNLIQLHQVV